MEGPTPVSALIHSATMVAAGVFMVARLYGIFQASPDALRVVAGLGAFTAVFAAPSPWPRTTSRGSSRTPRSASWGYMMLALGLATNAAPGVSGYGAGLFHLTTHAAFKTLLFLGAGSVIHALGTNDIRRMGGLGRQMPVTALMFAVAVLAIAGIFPLSGFWSKDAILEAVERLATRCSTSSRWARFSSPRSTCPACFFSSSWAMSAAAPRHTSRLPS